MLKKLEFVDIIKPILKEKGYRKNGLYWYKRNGELLLCINVQGSQWDKNNYYVEMGITKYDDNSSKYPTLLHWDICHRIVGKSGELNIEPEDLYQEIEKHHNICKTSDIPDYLRLRDARPVINQFCF